MNYNAKEMTAHVEELLKTYHQREREIAVLKYELANFTAVTETEHIDAMAFSRGDGTGRDLGHISNKTLHIALNYREQAARLNTEAVIEINKELGQLEQKQRRLRYYVSLLDERQKKVLELSYFQKTPLEEIARSLGLAERTVQDIRREAVNALADLYAIVARRL